MYVSSSGYISLLNSSSPHEIFLQNPCSFEVDSFDVNESFLVAIRVVSMQYKSHWQ